MRGSSSLCVALALLGACRPASPALLLGASLSDAFQPARPLRCPPLIVASANVASVQKVGEDSIGGEKKFMGGPFQILFEVGKEAAEKVRRVMGQEEVEPEEKAAIRADKEAFREVRRAVLLSALYSGICVESLTMNSKPSAMRPEPHVSNRARPFQLKQQFALDRMLNTAAEKGYSREIERLVPSPATPPPPRLSQAGEESRAP